MNSPFKVDWADLEQVQAYAQKLGNGVVVVKVQGLANYNITHRERAEKMGYEIIDNPKSR